MRTPEQKLHARIRNFNLKERAKWIETARWMGWTQPVNSYNHKTAIYLLFVLKGQEIEPNTLKNWSVKIQVNGVEHPIMTDELSEQHLQSAFDEFVRTFPFKITDIVTVDPAYAKAATGKNLMLPDYIK